MNVNSGENMSPAVKVVVVNSLSYTGTTWLNVVMGCHDRAFTLGPPDRVWKMCRSNESDGLNACLVHGKTCSFWPVFFNDYNGKENFFSQLARESGKDIIITNNPVPDGAGSELKSTAINVKQINLIRDGRALLASYMRKFPNVAAIDAISSFLYPSFHNFYFDENNPDVLCLRYEDILKNKQEHLENIGRFIGLSYEVRAQRFWEYEHHVTSGNQGTIACIKLGQDIPVPDFNGRDFYEKKFMEMKTGNQADFNDERWRQELSRRELFLFDLLCGDENQHFGYQRDAFSLDEISLFVSEIKEAKRGESLPENIVGHIDQRLLELLGSLDARGVRSANKAIIVSSIRKQLSLNWIRKHGVSLTPQQLKTLFPYVLFGTVFLFFMLLVVVFFV